MYRRIPARGFRAWRTVRGVGQGLRLPYTNPIQPSPVLPSFTTHLVYFGHGAEEPLADEVEVLEAHTLEVQDDSHLQGQRAGRGQVSPKPQTPRGGRMTAVTGMPHARACAHAVMPWAHTCTLVQPKHEPAHPRDGEAR